MAMESGSKDVSSNVICPVCAMYFDESVINAHVNECLNGIDLGDDNEFESSFEVPSSDLSENETKSDDPSQFSVDYLSQSTTDSQINVTKDVKDHDGELESKKHAWSFLKSPGMQTKGSQSSKTIMPRSVHHLSMGNHLPLSQHSRKQKSMLDSGHGNVITTAESFNPKRLKLQTNAKESGGLNSKFMESIESDLQEAKQTTKMKPQNVSSQNGSSLVQPLAEKMRPLSFDDFVGQEQVVGNNTMLRRLLELETFPSMILWGPPGCGKTTLAKIVSQYCRKLPFWRFVQMSATMSGIGDIKEAIQIAKNEKASFKRKTVLFIDEIHRFNKLQQDAFLPHVEDGTIVLIGATTENPSFHVNNALLSRCKVFVLEKLSVQNIEKILRKTLVELRVGVLSEDARKTENVGSCGQFSVFVEPKVIDVISQTCDGDARCALNCLQNLLDAKCGTSASNVTIVSEKEARESLLRSHVQYDRIGEEHYNCASALIKSIRGSDDNGAIYWLARMLEGGEDPLFIARRLVISASEDIGLADVHALPLAVSTFQACHFIGMPECALNLGHCVTYLARTSKSNEAYAALDRARTSIRGHVGPLPGVPLHLRNAPTKLMKDLGYHKGYQYNHSIKGPVHQEYLPKELLGTSFFDSSTKSQE